MGSFRHVSDSLVHAGRVVSFFDTVVATPAGDEIHRDVVRHPGAVSAVAFEGDRIWLVKQYRAPVDAELWEIPAGKLDHDGESLEATVVRELEEEVGRRPSSVEHLIELLHSPGFCDERQTVFLCDGLEAVPVRHDGPEEEHMVVELVDFDEAVAMATDGRITDAKSIVGILAAARRLGR